MDSNVTGSFDGLMGKAISLAARGAGCTSPNPMVGALIIDRFGKILGKGYHKRAGTAHAEVHAIDKVGRKSRGATMVVTLEPCNHTGRTGPCTEKIIEAGIKKVIVGAPDPNPLVSGSGVERLREAGIEVVEGVLSEKASRLNEAYNKYITTGLPFVTLKLAATLDGRVAMASGESKWITGPEARKLVHRMRAESDAVMVGSGTALADDPELTVRHVKGRNPKRVLVDTGFKVPLSSRLFNRPEDGVIVFTGPGADKDKIARARALGVEVHSVRLKQGRLSLKTIFRELWKRGIVNLLLECGPKLAADAIETGAADKVALFYGPKLIGAGGLPMMGPLGFKSLKRAPVIRDITLKKVGEDMLVIGYL